MCKRSLTETDHCTDCISPQLCWKLVSSCKDLKFSLSSNKQHLKKTTSTNILTKMMVVESLCWVYSLFHCPQVANTSLNITFKVLVTDSSRWWSKQFWALVVVWTSLYTLVWELCSSCIPVSCYLMEMTGVEKRSCNQSLNKGLNRIQSHCV